MMYEIIRIANTIPPVIGWAIVAMAFILLVTIVVVSVIKMMY